MRNFRKEKGITLIALIITIVVLLILAAVAIAAIQNENILSHANNAAVKYNGAVQNEQDILGGYLNFLNNQGGQGNETDSDLEFMERYVLGAEKSGRVLTDITNTSTVNEVLMGMMMGTFAFADEEETTQVDEGISVTYLGMDASDDAKYLYAYTKYNNKAYKIVVDYGTFLTESVEFVYKKEGREGDPVEYDSNGDGNLEDWIIITDRNGLVEIVSADAMGSLKLGEKDTSITVTSDIDDNGEIGNDVDIAILSYNNAITTINNYCKSLVTATDNEGVRSVGGTNNNFTPYNSTNFDYWNSKITVDIASRDSQHELDYVKLLYHGKISAGNEYWIASRRVSDKEDATSFSVLSNNANNNFIIGGMVLLRFYKDGAYATDTGDITRSVRPVVVNPVNLTVR